MADESPQKYRKLFGVDVPDDLEPIKIILDNSGENRTTRFDQDDIVDNTLRKLGDHVARITNDANNSPTINPGFNEINLRTSSGNPKPLTDNVDSASTTFTQELEKADQQVVSLFKETSNSKFLEPTEKLKLNLAKGKIDDKNKDTVLELYKDINENLEESNISKIIQERQLQDNRFSQTKEYINKNSSLEEEDSNVGRAHLQDQLGKYVPKKWPNTPNNNEDISFKIKNLKNLGIQVMMESSGEYYVPDDTDDFGKVILSKAATTAPGLARMGLRVRTNRFSAAEIAGQVNPKFKLDTKFPSLKDTSGLSYGSVNNPLVPFNAVSSAHSEAAAVLLAATIGGMLKALALAIDKLGANALTNPVASSLSSLGNLGKKDSIPSKTDREYRKDRLGKYTHSKNPTENEEKNKYSLGGLIVITENDYNDCVRKGFEFFFDAPSGGVVKQIVGAGIGAANAATNGLLGDLGVEAPYDKIADAPGYYSSILRMLIRSATSDILGLIGNVAGLFGNSDKVENVGGPGALDINKSIGLDKDPTNILNSLKSLQESKIVKFMNILAMLGDLTINIKESEESLIDDIIDLNSSRAFENSLSEAEKHFPNPASLVKKNRLSDLVGPYQGNIAWGSNTVRSMYLLPETIQKAEKQLFSKDAFSSKVNTDPNFIKADGTGRIKKELVEQIENELEACYMPFYFHDLRTNEILSFHAFIEDVSDSFDADYNESEGFGRIGKIYTYKNTNRSIQFGFKVVATNQKDFSQMWYKINRLVLMLYPQYSAGRFVKTPDGKFTQPFSQVITNSPMIRLRIGDLLKTNFSDLDLARLFGVGTDKFNLKGENNNEPKPKKETDSLKNITKKQEIEAYISGRNYDQFKSGYRFFVDTTVPEGTKPRHRSIMESKSNKMVRISKIPSARIPVEYVSDDPLTSEHFLVKVVGNNFPSLPKTLTLHKGSREEVGYELEIDSDYYDSTMPNETIEGPTDDTTITKNTQKSRDESEKIKDFFNSENNPIVKSFESTSGQGLAGFIKSISFDWSDARWETNELNYRAPMWCKLSVTFLPIYDINPGLDYTGEPIGMPYNVGSILKLMKRSRNSSKTELKENKYNDSKWQASLAGKKKESIDENDITDFIPG
jgi:hypothetical protein